MTPQARPKLLYLAYPFRPAPMIACVRTWNTAKHLSRLGWNVTVVTPHPSLWLRPENRENLEADAAALGFSLLFTGHGWPMLLPGDIRWYKGRVAWFAGGVCRRIARLFQVEAQVGWVASVKRACAALTPDDVDLILATAKPNSAFRAARLLGQRLDRPLVLDYRDPWFGNPHPGERIPSRPNPEEAMLLHECAAVTVVSPSWAELISHTFAVRDKVHVVSNGYDPEMFGALAPASFDHFAVVYAGTLYPPKRVLDPVLRAFKLFIANSDQASSLFHYYGTFGTAVREAAGALGIEEHVVIHEQVSRNEALQAQKGASIIVVVASVQDEATLSDKGIITGKLFDCLALNRPTMVLAPKGSDLYAITETTGGACCFTGRDVEGMARFMAEVASSCIPQVRNPIAYCWANISKELDSILRSCLRQ